MTPHDPEIEPYVPPLILDEAIRILKSKEFRDWTKFESRGITETAVHRLIQARMFEARSWGRVIFFQTGKPRYRFRIKVTGGWNRLEVVMQAIFDTHQVDPALIDERYYQQSKIEVRIDNYHEVRFRDLGEHAAIECESESGEALVRKVIVDASENAAQPDVYIDRWEDLQDSTTATTQSVASAYAISAPEINVNVAVPATDAPKQREPNQTLEKPGGKYHDDLMRFVHELRQPPLVLPFDSRMEDAVEREGFHRHSKTNLNDWYRDWKAANPGV